MHLPIHRFRRAALLLALAASALLAGAAENSLSVVEPYVRMPPPGTPTTGAFMTIRNSGDSDRKLIKVDSPVAGSVELHTHLNDNGVMKMRQVKDIDVKSKGEATLKPGSYHVMLIDLKQTLKEGDSVPLTLRFDDGSSQQINAPIKTPQAMMKMPMDGEHGKMKH